MHTKYEDYCISRPYKCEENQNNSYTMETLHLQLKMFFVAAGLAVQCLLYPNLANEYLL